MPTPLDDAILDHTEKSLFRHFCLLAHPQNCSKESRTWLYDLPGWALKVWTLKYDSQFLVINTFDQHEPIKIAVLGAAASHLAQLTGYSRRFREAGLAYRAKALSYMTTSPRLDTAETVHAARLSTYVLMFQSCCLDDGFTDMLVLSRGCEILRQKALQAASSGIFPWTNRGELTEWEQHMDKSVSAGPAHAQTAMSSLAMLESLQMTSTQQQIYNLFTRAAAALSVSPWDGFMGLSALYRYLARCNRIRLSEFTSTEDHCAGVLRAHFLALHAIQAIPPHEVRTDIPSRIPVLVMMRWIENIHQKLEPEWKHFVRWPLAIALSYKNTG